MEENEPGKHTEEKQLKRGKTREKIVLQKSKKKEFQEGRGSGVSDATERAGRVRVEERQFFNIRT